jgi:hypothetical protein
MSFGLARNIECPSRQAGRIHNVQGPIALSRKLTAPWFRGDGAKWPPAIKLFSEYTVT